LVWIISFFLPVQESEFRVRLRDDSPAISLCAITGSYPKQLNARRQESEDGRAKWLATGSRRLGSTALIRARPLLLPIKVSALLDQQLAQHGTMAVLFVLAVATN
jgi:hypothetical protein